jgi:hypothetical protein
MWLAIVSGTANHEEGMSVWVIALESWSIWGMKEKALEIS